MEYRVLLVKDINLDNIRYSTIKKSSNENRYSFITYLNNEDEIQNIVLQCKQMYINEISKNEKGHYYISFHLNYYMKSFLEKIEEKIKSDIKQFKNDKEIRFRSTIVENNENLYFKCKIGHISNLVVFDQYKKLYDDESEILKLLKIANQSVIPIIECLGLWISNDHEAGLTWICHHIKVIQNNTLFRKYLFIEENSEDESNINVLNEGNIQISNNSNLVYLEQSSSFRDWKKNLPEKTFDTNM